MEEKNAHQFWFLQSPLVQQADDELKNAFAKEYFLPFQVLLS
jgi:hypothetical protein